MRIERESPATGWELGVSRWILSVLCTGVGGTILYLVLVRFLPARIIEATVFAVMMAVALAVTGTTRQWYVVAPLAFLSTLAPIWVSGTLTVGVLTWMLVQWYRRRTRAARSA